jgi:TRAP-type C4-dicarboxylate transport system substrate-binding protein
MNPLRSLITALLLLNLAPSLLAVERIKLATLAPTGSSYYKSLLAMKEAWRKASGGAIDLVIYGDGKLGGESDTVGLMAVNSLQASMLTTVGLSDIEKGVAGLQNIPMGFHDFAEVDYVGQKLQPMLEEHLAKKGFVVLFWTDAGWVRFFSKKPLVHPDDLKPMKLFTWSGNPDQVEIYKSAGFNAVALETADILPGLETGLIDAAPLPPVFALIGQIDTKAPYMLELNWAPLVGACVIRKETWDAIAPTTRVALLTAAKAAGKAIKENGRKESAECVEAMQERGLKVTKVTPEIEAEWRKAAEAEYPEIRGRIVPDDVFDAVLGYIKEYRAAHAH